MSRAQKLPSEYGPNAVGGTLLQMENHKAQTADETQSPGDDDEFIRHPHIWISAFGFQLPVSVEIGERARYSFTESIAAVDVGSTLFSIAR
jgi:hypothetical protein